MPLILATILCLLLAACGPSSDSPEYKIKQLLSKIEDEPKNPTLHYELGRAYIEKKQYNSAHNQLVEAIRLKGDYGEAYREKGIALFYLKKYFDAEKALQKSFSLKPTQADIATDLGSIFIATGNVKKSLRYLKIAQTRNNNMHIVFNNMGAAHAEIGQNKQAIGYWEKALEHHPLKTEVHINMGVVYERMGKKKKAMASYQKALEQDNRNAIAHYNLGVLHAKNKDITKAVESWKKAKKLDSTDDKVLTSLGWAYEKLGDKEKALDEILKSIKIEPFNTKTHYAAGRIQSDLGNFENAIVSLKKSVNLDPEFGDAYYRLGIVYDNINQGNDAISNTLIAEIIYHKKKKMDLFKKMGTKLELLFDKNQLTREDFTELQLPDTLEGYDLHKKSKRIRTSREK
ncbi:MAG: tetratricopeptide repeat protein [Nitrospinae bacterium]|nr:tetratricopeptide repeat protein [Nitrospinota bacterium]